MNLLRIHWSLVLSVRLRPVRHGSECEDNKLRACDLVRLKVHDICHGDRVAARAIGLLPGAMRGLPFDRKVEALLLDRSDVALIVRPMLVAWRQLREQIDAFDKAIRALVKSKSRLTPLFVRFIRARLRMEWLPAGRGYGWLREWALSGVIVCRCGHCSTCASDQMLRRIIPTAERTVTRGGDKKNY